MTIQVFGVLAASIAMLMVRTADGQSGPVRASSFIKLGSATVEVGKESALGPDLFGGIGSVAIDSEGAIYVLDVSDNSVRMFDERGQFIARVGQPGRGPGDLASPHRIFHDGDSTLYVVDGVNGVSKFRTTRGAIRFLDVFGASLRTRSACLLGPDLVVAGFRDGRLLHFIDERGEISRSIGSAFPIHPPPGIKYPVDTIAVLKEYANINAPALAACSTPHGIIVVAQLQGPGIRAYASSGRLIWSAEIPEYGGHTYWQDPQGRPVTVFGLDATRTLLLLDPNTILVQVSRRQPYQGRASPGTPLRVEHTSLTSRVYDLRTGRVLATGTDLPFLAAVRGDVVVEGEDDPFPRIRIRRFTQSSSKR